MAYRTLTKSSMFVGTIFWNGWYGPPVLVGYHLEHVYDVYVFVHRRTGEVEIGMYCINDKYNEVVHTAVDNTQEFNGENDSLHQRTQYNGWSKAVRHLTNGSHSTTLWDSISQCKKLEVYVDVPLVSFG